MKIFRSSAEVPETFGPSIVTIGNFDGVHAGHRQIMRRVVALSLEKGCTPTVLTFDPHPARVLAQPVVSKVEVSAKLCTTDGLALTKVPSRAKADYARARRWRWGDALFD